MPKGIVRRDPRELSGQWPRFQRHWFADPSPDLSTLVSRYWAVRWDYRGQPPYRQLIVPHPNVHLSFVTGSVPMVRGVSRGHVFRVLKGTGRVFGVAFRPGCFRPLLGRSVSTITDRSVAARHVFGSGIPQRAMEDATSEPEMVRIVERFLHRHAPPREPVAEEVADMVAKIAATPDLTRVDNLADRLGAGVRRLQRLFAEYVGVGPKWVIRRYRLHEVTERMASGGTIDWAGLAADLGYADQAHFTRDFTAMVGETPTAYAQRYPT